MSLRSSIVESWPGTVLRNEGLVLGLRTEIVPCAISALTQGAEFGFFTELRLKTEGVSQKVAKVAKVWR